MEIELKYLIPNREIADSIWKEQNFHCYGEVDKVKRIEMKAVYYDTDDFILSEVGASFRIRKEGDMAVATIKWGSSREASLHEREEINIQLSEDFSFEKPSLDIFGESEKGQELIKMIGDKKLLPIVHTDFFRNTARLDMGNAICEIAMDDGKVVTSKGSEDILELEIELFSGDVDAIIEIGNDLQKKFPLIPGEISKFGRGMKMLNKYKGEGNKR